MVADRRGTWERQRWLALFGAFFTLAACGDGSPSQVVDDEGADMTPGPGPHFEVTPLPVETLARITAIGYNNKILPVPHTYWDTCDGWVVQPSDRPCHLERQPVRAPGSGIVLDVRSMDDGDLMVEGPPGLIWQIGHVTPRDDLEVGDSVEAGEVVATMYYEHGIDFGLINRAISHTFARPERHSLHSLHGQHPILQMPEPLRSELTDLVRAPNAELGRVSYDEAGTAAGLWVLQGTNQVEITGSLDPKLLHLGRWTERPETRIVTVGSDGPGPGDQLLAVDPSDPSWESIEPRDGPSALRLWHLGTDASPNLARPAGTLLVELVDEARLRVEWFDTHDSVSSFTEGASMYGR